MVPTLSGAGVILGGLIDYGTGAVYDLQPNPLTVTLACGPTPHAGLPAHLPEFAIQGRKIGRLAEFVAF